jgi:hypothetical protein
MNKQSSEQILEVVENDPRLQKRIVRSLKNQLGSVRRVGRFCGGIQRVLWSKVREIGCSALEGYREGRADEKSTQGDES